MSLNRPRDAGDGSDEVGPEILQCPVEGCNRTVIGDSTAMRNHVRNLTDDLHDGKVLDENLEVVSKWSEMDWEPGFPDEPPDQPPKQSESKVKSAARVTW